VALLVTLVLNLRAFQDTFMLCNQKDTPALKNYGEVLLCHYTKGFVFCFPAMASGVCVLLFGRNLLQQRLYYGLLKAGGVVSFSENTAMKDPFFMATFVAFCHSIGYTILHMIVLSRTSHDPAVMHGFFLEASGASETTASPTDLSSTTSISMGLATLTKLAMKGAEMLMILIVGGPTLGAGTIPAKPPPIPAGAAEEEVDSLIAFNKYLETVMVLVFTVLETTLLLLFFYFAYDITHTLVPMSEYLASYEEERDEDVRKRLYSLKDSAAKAISEHSPQLISGTDGDINGVYKRLMERYRQNNQMIKARASQPAIPSPEEPFERPESIMDLINFGALGSIGLIRSLWPAELLMRRDIKGRDPKTFRRAWVIYSTVAIIWLLQVLLLLVWYSTWAGARLMNKEFEQLIPLSIIMLHGIAIVVVVSVFIESLAPLAFTQGLMGADRDS